MPMRIGRPDERTIRNAFREARRTETGTMKELSPEEIAQNNPVTLRVGTDETISDRFAGRDSVSISEEGRMFQAAKALTQSDNAAEAEETGSVSGKTSMGINAAKLARKLSAARTQSQIRVVMAEIQSDLKECESGKAQGADVDEASVEAAERLLQEARQRMGQVENREPTPEEEMASALASLF